MVERGRRPLALCACVPAAPLSCQPSPPPVAALSSWWERQLGRGARHEAAACAGAALSDLPRQRPRHPPLPPPPAPAAGPRRPPRWWLPAATPMRWCAGEAGALRARWAGSRPVGVFGATFCVSPPPPAPALPSRASHPPQGVSQCACAQAGGGGRGNVAGAPAAGHARGSPSFAPPARAARPLPVVAARPRPSRRAPDLTGATPPEALDGGRGRNAPRSASLAAHERRVDGDERRENFHQRRRLGAVPFLTLFWPPQRGGRLGARRRRKASI